ncbi:MAG TPA: cobalamin-independent methionine synthase II family protein [Terriglobia bacterium]|nr:cobalamin-independent methionine synthase II family protein [Terriglobia bacterium]
MVNSFLPLLPTSVVGSYARPAWVWTALEAARRGELGPADLEEVQNDAVDMAIHDQEEAGVDVVSDGEMRRSGFFTAEFYRHLTGLRPLEPDRRKGASGHDQQHRFEVLEPVTAPHGLGVVAEFEYARTRTERPLRVTIPGPFTLSGRMMTGSVYPNRRDAAWALVPILNAELKALAAAGAKLIQIDEPSPAIHPECKAEFAELFNAAGEGVEAHLAAHLCFGNYAGRPLGKRSYAAVLDQMMQYKVAQLVLEFANRELAELPLLKEISASRDVAVGLVDVKSYYIETPEDVAQRIQKVLQYVSAERLTVVPDCGFSQTARWAARQKLRAMVEGTRKVRTMLQAPIEVGNEE